MAGKPPQRRVSLLPLSFPYSHNVYSSPPRNSLPAHTVRISTAPKSGALNTCESVWSYSKKLCCSVFIGESTGDVFTGAAAHLRVYGWYVHLVLKR